MNKRKILERYNFKSTEEQVAIAKILDMMNVVETRDLVVYSDFLDLQKQSMVDELSKKYHIGCQFYGGYEDTERTTVSFYPLFLNRLDEESYPIKILNIRVKGSKFSKQLPGHRDYLGSILGLGLDRSKVGDIICHDTGAYAIVKEEIMAYIIANLTKVKHANVEVLEVKDSSNIQPNVQVEVANITVASTRLDAIIGKGLGISRGKVADLIAGGKVFVNWKQIEKNDFKINEEDKITIRGYGRLKIAEIGGTTKKGRIRVMIYINR